MGGHNMYTVMKALKGVEITIPCDDKDTQADGGKSSKRRILQAPELMLLLAVAHRQSDGHENLKVTEAICAADHGTMSSLAHVSRASVYKLRDRLCQAGLINYYKSGTFRDFKGKSVKKKRFSNVYQLNFPSILRYSDNFQEDEYYAYIRDARVSQGEKKVSDREKKSPREKKKSPRETLT